MNDIKLTNNDRVNIITTVYNAVKGCIGDNSSVHLNMNVVEDDMKYRIKRTIPEQIGNLQRIAENFHDDIESFRKQVEKKKLEIKQLEENIKRYEQIKIMWIKEVEKGKIKLKAYEEFYKQLTENKNGN